MLSLQFELAVGQPIASAGFYALDMSDYQISGTLESAASVELAQYRHLHSIDSRPALIVRRFRERARRKRGSNRVPDRVSDVGLMVQLVMPNASSK